MRKTLTTALIAAGTALAAGCGTVHATGGTLVGAASVRQGAVPIDAALVTPGFGWVLTADRLLVSRDGGAGFTDAGLPLPPTPARAAYFRDAAHGFVAASRGSTIMTATTGDGGRTWRTGALRDPAARGVVYGPLRAAFGDAAHGAVLAQTSTSAMSSRATLFATDDGGTSWSARTAPTAGEIGVEPGGRTWLAGGVAGDRLHVTSDAGRHWSAPDVRVDGSAATKAVAPPRDGVLPVTVVTPADRTEVALLTTSDAGRTWRETNRVPVRGRTGPGVRVPVARAGGTPLVVDTAGGHAYRAAPHRSTGLTAADVTAPGLPEGVHTVTFSPDGRDGWALATYGRCAHGKHDCTLYHPLLATTDGGGSWHRILLWRQRLG